MGLQRPWPTRRRHDIATRNAGSCARPDERRRDRRRVASQLRAPLRRDASGPGIWTAAPNSAMGPRIQEPHALPVSGLTGVSKITAGGNTSLAIGTSSTTNGRESGSASATPGGSVTSDTEGDGATAADPVEVSVTSPTGGSVTIRKVPGYSPSGFSGWTGKVLRIDAPQATVANPLVLTFRLDVSAYQVGWDVNTATSPATSRRMSPRVAPVQAQARTRAWLAAHVCRTAASRSSSAPLRQATGRSSPKEPIAQPGSPYAVPGNRAHNSMHGPPPERRHCPSCGRPIRS